MRVYEHDYKGKWFVLSDEPEDENAYQDTDEIDLDGHADACLYYGIPMYVGEDKDFRKKCDKALRRAITRDEERERERRDGNE